MSDATKMEQARKEIEDIITESSSELTEALTEVIIDNDELLEQVVSITSLAVLTTLQGVSNALNNNDIITTTQHEAIFLELFEDLDD